MDVFKRYEYKYLVNKSLLIKLKELLASHNFFIDDYGLSTIKSLYFDTPNNLLVTRSLDKPIYKEKLRLRGYSDSSYYLEIKKKYDGIVYKRRIKTNLNECSSFLDYNYNYKCQIGQEINFFRDYYKELMPSMLIMYEREAYHNLDSDLRITIDYDIRYRNYKLWDFDYELGNKLIDGYILLEIKCSSAYPLWLVRFLSENKIFKCSFSKYGYAYLDSLGKEYEGDVMKCKDYLNPSLAMVI